MADAIDVRRTAFLHEAGHAVVALEHGLVVEYVMCDGEVGFCHADLSIEINTKLTQLLADGQSGKIAPLHVLTQGTQLYFGRLATLLGGIAGESLVVGRPIFATRRASDDLPAFFGFLAILSRGLPAPQSDPVWIDVFERAQDAAWETVRRRHAEVEKLADALTAQNRLTGHQVAGVLLG